MRRRDTLWARWRAIAAIAIVCVGGCARCGGAGVDPGGTKPASASASTVASATPSTSSSDEGTPPVDLTCIGSLDCAFTNLAEDCCDACIPRVGSKAWVTHIRQYCIAHGRKHCPSRVCAAKLPAVRCIDGRCTIVDQAPTP